MGDRLHLSFGLNLNLNLELFTRRGDQGNGAQGLDVVTGRGRHAAEDAAGGSLHVQRGLVCLDDEERLALLDGITLALIPTDQLDDIHRLAQRRHEHFDRHLYTLSLVFGLWSVVYRQNSDFTAATTRSALGT